MQLCNRVYYSKVFLKGSTCFERHTAHHQERELLMMSGVPLETCWAFKKLWNNKFHYKAASCWYFYWVIYDARTHEYQIWCFSILHLSSGRGTVDPTDSLATPLCNFKTSSPNNRIRKVYQLAREQVFIVSYTRNLFHASSSRTQ